MTREEAKDFMWVENDKNPAVIKWQHHSTISGLVSSLIDKIFDEHEAQLKDAEFAITVLNENLRLNGELLKAKDEEIERLRTFLMQSNRESVLIGNKIGESKARSIVAMLFWG